MTIRRAEAARSAILDAAIEAFRMRGIGFAMQDVADAAGIAHRTVYRYFATRDELLAAIVERSEARVADSGLVAPDDLDELADFIPRLFAQFERHADESRLVALDVLANGTRGEARRQRSERFRRGAEKLYPHVPESELLAISATIRSFMGIVGWHVLTNDTGVSTEQAAFGVGVAMRALRDRLEELELEHEHEGGKDAAAERVDGIDAARARTRPGGVRPAERGARS